MLNGLTIVQNIIGDCPYFLGRYFEIVLLPNPKYERLFFRLAIIFLVIGVFITLMSILLHYVALVAGYAFALAVICWIQAMIFAASSSKDPEKRLSYVRGISLCYWGGMLICFATILLFNLNYIRLGILLCTVGGIVSSYAICNVVLSLGSKPRGGSR